MSAPLPRDAQVALSAIHAMSLDNETDGSGGPWVRALERFTSTDRGFDHERCAANLLLSSGEPYSLMERHWCREWAEPMSDGDRPDGLEWLTDGAVDYIIALGSTTYAGQDALLCGWLARRALHLSRRFATSSAVIRETHPELHQALSDGETVGPTIKGCPWCKAGGK